MAWTNAWDETSPTDNTAVINVDNEIRKLRLDIRERLGNDHYTLASDTTGTTTIGQHTQITFYSQVADPSPTGDEAILQQNADGELEYFTPSGSVVLTRSSGTDLPALPAGVIQMYGAAAAPSGWLLCDGSAVSRATYSDLFDVIQTTFGVGDGSTTFNVPDMRGRVPVGAGSGAGLTARTLGETAYGAETHTLTKAEMPKHSHKPADSSSFMVSSGTGSGSSGSARGYQTTTDEVGGDGAHNNMQPSTTLTFIIKT